MSRNTERKLELFIHLLLACVVLLSTMPGFSFAAEKKAASKEPSKITVTRTDKIANKWGGYVTGIKTGKTKGTLTIEYGEKKEFTVKTYNGYYLIRVLVDGKSIGRKKTFEIKGDGENHTVVAEYAKGTFKIKVDPGHAGYYNKGAIKGYWESRQVWKLSNYLVPLLNNYPGVVATMTKKNLNHDPLVYERGKMAKGNDLFISIHSNSSSSQSTDYPLSIVSYSKRQLYNVAQPLGKLLSDQVKKTMTTRQKYQVWVKKQSDGRDWYGVIRGSSDVNVPGIIIEHSFHSNKRMASWLMKNANLKTMAQDEVKVITEYYGFGASGQLIKPETPEDYAAKSTSKGKVSLAWKKQPVTGYEVFRATKEKGKYKKITNLVARSYKETDLKSGRTYYYKIRSYRCNGTRISFSPFTEIKKVKVN